MIGNTVSLLTCSECGIGYWTEVPGTDLVICSELKCSQEVSLSRDIQPYVDASEELVRVIIGGRTYWGVQMLDLPDMDTAWAAGFSDHDLPVTWQQVAERMIETFGLEVD